MNKILMVGVCALVLGMTAPLQAQEQGSSGRLLTFGDSSAGQDRPLILRGSSATRRAVPAPQPAPSTIRAGRTLWSLDSDRGEVAACRLRNTANVDGVRIQCVERRLR